MNNENIILKERKNFMINKYIEGYIDHTMLSPSSSFDNIFKTCKEAKENNFASVCINPCFVCYAKSLLKDSKVNVCTVIGFPLGASTKEVKVFEAKNAIENGANEIDMVINIGMLKSGELEYIKEEIKDILNECKNKAILKVIIETSLLTKDEKILICKICKELKVDYIKTSTGFSGEGAKVEDIILIKTVVGDNVKIKASGGIKSYEDAIKMINSGASRLGTSKAIDILNKK